MRTLLVLASTLLVSGPILLGQSQVPATTVQQTASPVELSTFSPNLVLPLDPSKPLRVSGGVIVAQILKKTIPVFPPKTNCRHISGAVAMHAIIGKDGYIKSVEAISGADVMRQPYVDAVRQWQFRPFQLHGKPVEVETTITTHSDFNVDGC